MNISIDIKNYAGPVLVRLGTGLENRKDLHSRIAGDSERFLKISGARIAATQHRSAEVLGASPTQHLLKAYNAIESEGTADAAVLRVPRASRLRAAFGAYVVRPGPGKTFLTIPVHRDAYGRRAGEISNLFFVSVGPLKTPVLARPTNGGKGMETMYLLTKSAQIKAAPELIPMDLLRENAQLTVETYINDLVEKGGPV